MDAILVAETTAKDVVFSTTCLKTYTSEDGTQLVVEVTRMSEENMMMATGGVEMILGGVHEVIKYADATLDVVKGGLAIAAFFIPPASGVLLALAGLGSGIQFLMGLVPDHRPDPVVEKMKDLEKAIHELEKKVNEKFNDLKLFITESEFSVDVISEAAVLTKLMRNCFKYQNRESFDTFKDAYERNSPLTLAYIMISLLEQKATNPLVMAMTVDHSEATFDKWEKTIKSILAQLLFVEAFASGLLKEKNFYDCDRLVDRSKEVDNALEDWRNEYNYSHYWKEMKNHLIYNIGSYNASNKDWASLDIINKLKSFSTKDSFYVFVFENAKYNDLYVHRPIDDQHQKIGAWNDEVAVIIYRSLKANSKQNSDFDEMEKIIEECREQKFHYHGGTLEDVIQHQFINAKIISDDYFICLIDDKCEPVIRYTNCSKYGRSPGSFGKILLYDRLSENRETTKTLIIVLP